MTAARPTDTAASTRARIQTISVIAPMLNEAEHISGFVDDIAHQDFDGDVELIVADGGSDDGSADRLREAAARHALPLTVLDNPSRWVSNGLNLCLAVAKGDLIVRVDCHSRYPADYLRRCALASDETGADNVGGVLLARGRTPMERAVACAMDGPFGGVLWTRHAGDARVETDTVPFGAFRADVFARAGVFDEAFVRNQDDEFNLRLRRAGGKIVLDPSIKVYYTPRGSLRRVFRQYFEYGFWKPAVMRKHRRPTTLRSLVPVLFVISLVVLGIGSLWRAEVRLLLAAELVLYAGGAVVFGVLALRRCGQSPTLLPRVIACFPAFHVAYGVGMIAGAVRVLGRPSG